MHVAPQPLARCHRGRVQVMGADLHDRLAPEHVLAGEQVISDRAQRVEIDDGRWTGWVPVRVPDTIAVDKKLPAGAAAVLINPRHTFTDLYMPIRAEERVWLEAIDGTRTIDEIVGNPADRAAARSLFERLWWYDQVVFDSSASPP